MATVRDPVAEAEDAKRNRVLEIKRRYREKLKERRKADEALDQKIKDYNRDYMRNVRIAKGGSSRQGCVDDGLLQNPLHSL